MEVSILTRPDVSELLESFVEIRLHVDASTEIAEGFKNYAIELVGTSGIPVYAIVDPETPDVALAVFKGANLPGGQRFRAWLKDYLAAN